MSDLYAQLKEVANGLLSDLGADMTVLQTNPVTGAISTSVLRAVRAERSKATDDEGVPIGDWKYIVGAPEGFNFKIGDKFTFAGSTEIVMLANELKPANLRIIWEITSRLG